MMLGLVITMTLSVCADCTYRTIAEAVAHAAPGDRVEVGPGIYREAVTIDKALVLTGSSTVMDGEWRRPILQVLANDVRVEGITFTHSGRDLLADTAAVRITRAKRCSIIGNRFEDNFFAVYLEEAEDCQIQNNEVEGVPRGEGGSGNGIHVWNSRGIVIAGNVVRGHRDGIYLEFAQGSMIEHNLASHNIRYGLHFMYSDNNTFAHNQFTRNGAGVAVMYSRHVTMQRNVFQDQPGKGSYGLLLKEISDSSLQCNRFDRNAVALHVDQSNRNQVRNNEFRNNGLAVSLWGSAENNEFRDNTFVGNMFDVYTNSTASSGNHLESNFFSDYWGYDRDRDGYGDLAYRPVSLSAVILARYPLAGVLARSLFLDLLDASERLVPAFSPAELVDVRPRLVPSSCEHAEEPVRR